jgi:UDP-N-acetylmuramate dehydrogenase
LALEIADQTPLAPLTTLELGGAARHLVTVADEASALEALRWAAARDLPIFVLGGGSNVVVSDAGFPGLVIRVGLRGITFASAGDRVRVQVAAGEPWDDVVAETVRRGLGGLECLSGIPGLAGATPIQNVGAYGQDVSETIVSVNAIDRTLRASLTVVELPAVDCAFGYRDSAFKRQPDRWLVLGVTFALRADGVPAVRYPELANALAARTVAPTLADVRDTVIALRRAKSMVIDPADPNRRSAGSFFMNPVVTTAQADRLVAQLLAERIVADAAAVPRYPAGAGQVKLSAAWLIERAGLSKGLRAGAVGISSRHTLAMVHHGGGTTAELLAFADHVRDTVERRFGVRLRREPVLVS